jgi:hypothetical protein
MNKKLLAINTATIAVVGGTVGWLAYGKKGLLLWAVIWATVAALATVANEMEEQEKKAE